MSVEHEPYVAYGIEVGPPQLVDYFGAEVYCASGAPEEWAEALALAAGLTCTQAGNAWTGVELYIIGPKLLRSDSEATMVVDRPGLTAVRLLATRLKCELRWHIGMWTY